MYNRPRIIPVLLIDDRDLIKTICFNSRTYLGDPVNAVKIFNRKRIDELVILDIGASKKQRIPDYDLLKDIASEAFMPLSYGGGITSIEEVKRLFSIGYEKIVINTSLIRNASLIEKAVTLYGAQSIVASIDAKKFNNGYKCMIADGTEIIDISPVELAKKAEKLGVGEIIINSIDNDGLMNGYDLDLVQSVADAISIPVTALGGAKGISDLKAVLEIGHAHAAAAGSMFVYYGKLKAVLITAPTETELLSCGIYK